VRRSRVAPIREAADAGPNSHFSAPATLALPLPSKYLLNVVESTDAELVACAPPGDVDAFEALYRRHASRIYALARRMSGSPEAGEDLLQEIFLLAYRKLASFKGDAAIGTWLYAGADGDLTAASVSGSVRVKGLKGHSLNLGTVSGDLTLSNVACDRLGARSVSGNVEYTGTLTKNGRYDLNSHSGTVRLALDGTTGFELNASSFSGSIRSELPLTTVTAPIPAAATTRAALGGAVSRTITRCGRRSAMRARRSRSRRSAATLSSRKVSGAAFRSQTMWSLSCPASIRKSRHTLTCRHSAAWTEEQ